MRSICTPADCTACGACENICPKQCVTRHMRDDDSWYLEIDDDQCVNCHMCDVVCPNKTSPKLNMPERLSRYGQMIQKNTEPLHREGLRQHCIAMH